jgi:hypothetical protein
MRVRKQVLSAILNEQELVPLGSGLGQLVFADF